MPIDATHLIEARKRNVGRLSVSRLLPVSGRRSVGPFVFFDHMGPVEFARGKGLDVAPHPHIGLSTLTYLFAGEITHRDSLKSEQVIRPGDVNWMTAGHGIVHSERTPLSLRSGPGELNGLQIWIGLPTEHEECEPAFEHHPASDLPVWQEDGVLMRLIAGSAFGKRSPVSVFSEMFYIDAQCGPSSEFTLPPALGERAVYVVEGEVTAHGQSVAMGNMLAMQDGIPIEVTARSPSRVMLLGGAPLDGPRHIWWNFVSSSKERIEQAKSDWAEGRFGKVPGETQFVPLPETKPRGPAPSAQSKEG